MSKEERADNKAQMKKDIERLRLEIQAERRRLEAELGIRPDEDKETGGNSK